MIKLHILSDSHLIGRALELGGYKVEAGVEGGAAARDGRGPGEVVEGVMVVGGCVAESARTLVFRVVVAGFVLRKNGPNIVLIIMKRNTFKTMQGVRNAFRSVNFVVLYRKISTSQNALPKHGREEADDVILASEVQSETNSSLNFNFSGNTTAISCKTFLAK